VTINGSCSCPKLRREPRLRTQGTVFYLFSGRVVVPQDPVKPTCLWSRIFGSRNFYLARGFAQGAPKSIPVRCFKEPNWVHCPESRLRKKRSGLSMPGQGIHGWGELPARPGYSDDCGGSFPLHEEPGPALPLSAVPSTVRNPARIRCSMFPLVPGCSCKVPACRTPSLYIPELFLCVVGTVTPFDRVGTFPIPVRLALVGGTDQSHSRVREKTLLPKANCGCL
jgi:hypothetical protein